MEATRGVECIEFSGGRREKRWDTVPAVFYYDLLVNGRRVAELRGMPVSLKELAVGFLLTNAYVDDVHIIENVRVYPDRVEVEADSEFDFKFEHYVSEGKKPLDDVKLGRINSHYTIPRTKILEKAKIALNQAVLTRDLGGTTFAAVTDDNGLFFLAEDVYPESALYKAVGKAVSVNFDFRRSIILVSETITPEFVVYTAILGTPLLGSFRGVSSLSIDLAENVTGQTLFLTDGERVRVYTVPQRVV